MSATSRRPTLKKKTKWKLKLECTPPDTSDSVTIFWTLVNTSEQFEQFSNILGSVTQSICNKLKNIKIYNWIFKT